MANRKNDVEPQWLEDRAREGLGMAQIAKLMTPPLTGKGLGSLLDRRPELKEAFQNGQELHREDKYSAVLRLFETPGVKANDLLNAYDKMARHGDVERIQQMRRSVLGHLTDDELVALATAVQRKELEKRLNAAVNRGVAPMREDAGEVQQVEVRDGE